MLQRIQTVSFDTKENDSFLSFLEQNGILWERPWILLSKPEYQSPGDTLLGMETPVRGMEIALSFCNLPVGLANKELHQILYSASLILGLKLEQTKCFSPLNFNSMTVPELKGECVEKLMLAHETILSVDKDPSACFFLSCAQQFVNNLTSKEKTENHQGRYIHRRDKLKDTQGTALISTKETYGNCIMKPNKERLLFAAKCSLSLGLAVLIGLLFDRENGYWSGLTIAISFVEGRQAIFTAANARAQGTAIGSVYGVLGCAIFGKLVKLRFLALLPWIVFTNFLRHSQMYGQAGGISAVIGALLILGRKNYGPPKEFAIARLTEAIIGLCSFIFVELLFQPTRASTLAKKHLYLSLVTLQECIKQIDVSPNGNDQSSMRLEAFKNKQRNLNCHIHDLQSSIAEAELEPNFWFIPFRSSCYQKLQESLSNIAILLPCMTQSLEFLLQASHVHFDHWKELQEQIEDVLELGKEILSTSLSCLEKLTFLKPYQVVQEPQEKIFHDPEKGNLPTENSFAASNVENVNSSNIAKSFVQQLKNVADNMRDSEGGEELKAKMFFSLSALGFCIGCLVREIKDTERGIKELIYWENP